MRFFLVTLINYFGTISYTLIGTSAFFRRTSIRLIKEVRINIWAYKLST